MKSPFSCGTQYLDWVDSNCCRCAKSYNNEAEKECEIEQALSIASVFDGRVTDEIAQRMGFTDHLTYCWMCPEVEWTKAWMKEKTERDAQMMLPLEGGPA